MGWALGRRCRVRSSAPSCISQGDTGTPTEPGGSERTFKVTVRGGETFRPPPGEVVPGAGPIPGSLSVHTALPLASQLQLPGPGSPPNLLSPPQVLSGCAIIVRGQPRGGPPPERQINLSNIRAGNLARRAAAGQPDAKDTPDEVGAPRQQCHADPLPRGWGSPGC